MPVFGPAILSRPAYGMLRHGVETPIVPRVTPDDAPYSHGPALDHPVFLDSFVPVVRAGGVKATCIGWKQGGYRALVEPYQPQDRSFHVRCVAFASYRAGWCSIARPFSIIRDCTASVTGRALHSVLCALHGGCVRGARARARGSPAGCCGAEVHPRLCPRRRSWLQG